MPLSIRPAGLARFVQRCLVAVAVIAVGVTASAEEFDLVIYGGTPAAITAAIEATDAGLSVTIICPDQRLGGMTTNGLGWTDSKDSRAIGGLAREFYHRVWLHYRRPDAWREQRRPSYQAHAQPGPAIDDRNEVAWAFEPHVAQQVFDTWLAEKGLTPHTEEWLDRDCGVRVEDGVIRSLTTLSGKVFRGKMFIDASYEGDLMAAAGVTCRIGRDAKSEHSESLNGILFSSEACERHADRTYDGVDPHIRAGDPSSGLIAGIEKVVNDPFPRGAADRRIQSFNYRLCLTDPPANKVEIAKPEGYDPAEYELLLRLFEAGQEPGLNNKPMPNRKTDTNNQGLMSLDYVGANFSDAEGWSYGEADYTLRREIERAHRRYTAGLLWTLQNHERVPAKVRGKWSPWGFARDEFADNDHWPRQLYVREARRTVGEAVMTEHHIKRAPGYEVADSIGMGSYSLDSHVVRRVVYRDEI